MKLFTIKFIPLIEVLSSNYLNTIHGEQNNLRWYKLLYKRQSPQSPRA